MFPVSLLVSEQKQHRRGILKQERLRGYGSAWYRYMEACLILS
jgi:hypothetical protein